jgi:hypothetical protein
MYATEPGLMWEGMTLRIAGMKIPWFEIAYGGKFQNDRHNF